MVKKVISFVFFLLILPGILFSMEIRIKDDCLKEKDIFINGGNRNIYCSFYPGERKILNPSVLLKNSGGKMLKFKLNRGEFLTVIREGNSVTKDLLTEMILKLYKKNFPHMKIKIEKIVFGKNIYFVKKNDIRILPASLKLGSVYFDLFNGFKHYKVYAYIKGYEKVLVSKTRIKKGEPLDELNTQLEEMDITRYWSKLVDAKKEYISKKYIPAGRIITEDYVLKKPDAFKGSMVKLYYKSKYITVSTIGVLMENAYKNSIVKVQNPSSKKTLLAKYVGDGVAFVVAN